MTVFEKARFFKILVHAIVRAGHARLLAGALRERTEFQIIVNKHWQ
jgi:hypothetical protein